MLKTWEHTYDASPDPVTTRAIQREVKVPLIGGKLETLLADTLGAAIRIENQVGDAWLKGGR